MVKRGRWLRDIRRGLGLSQESLAWRMQTTQQNVSRVEQGRQEPGARLKEEWGQWIKVKVEWEEREWTG